MVPLEEFAFDDDTALMRDNEEDEEEEELVVAPMRDVDPALATSGAGVAEKQGVAPTRKKWMVAAAIAGLVVLIGASAIAIRTRGASTQPAAKPVERAVVAQTPVVAPPISVVPLPPRTAIVDSSAGQVRPSIDSVNAAAAALRPRPRPRRVVRDSTALRDTTSRGDALPVFRDASPTRRDSLVKRDTLVRPDTTPM